MNQNDILQQVIQDVKTNKSTSNMQQLKASIHTYSLEELNTLKEEINTHFYFGQHGVDDIAWFNLIQTIQETINMKLKKID